LSWGARYNTCEIKKTQVPTWIGFSSVFIYNLYFFTSNGVLYLSTICFFSHRTADNKPRAANGESQTPNDERRVATLIGFGLYFFTLFFFTSNGRQQTTSGGRQKSNAKR